MRSGAAFLLFVLGITFGYCAGSQERPNPRETLPEGRATDLSVNLPEPSKVERSAEDQELMEAMAMAIGEQREAVELLKHEIVLLKRVIRLREERDTVLEVLKEKKEG